uniref:Geranylgeranyl transferase type-2 subunit alpha n=1 Tax=Panagrellus redivivus TaxID=6233 RepID=A0A7E4VY68_PANRE
MHGMQKLEESARKAREKKRQKKMAEFSGARSLVFKLFSKIDGNERPFLDTTGQLLTAIPDLYSFWVMRRQTLELVKKKMEADPEFTLSTPDELERAWKQAEARREAELKKNAKTQENAGGDAVPEVEVEKMDVDIASEEPAVDPKPSEETCEEVPAEEKQSEPSEESAKDEPTPKSYPRPTFDEVIDAEIALSEAALLSNHKSYSAWNHRRWCMEIHTNPPLDRELKLCEKALTIDCRNFHVWDYRRFVVRSLKRTLEQELKYAEHMVKQNPSNYSAWHYRINLLMEAGGTISDEMFDKEIRQITEVCVVNSEDQTAWTYVHWLIEHFFDKAFASLDGLANVVSFTEDSGLQNGEKRSMIVFYNAVNVKVVKSFVKGEKYVARGQRSPVTTATSAHIWDIYSTSTIDFLPSEDQINQHFSVKTPSPRRIVNETLIKSVFSKDPAPMSDLVKDALQFFLETCNELMKENDESNPWEICAYAHLLPFVNGTSDETEEIVNEYVAKAKKADPQRTEMYDTMLDRVHLINGLNQNALLQTIFEKEVELSFQLNDYSLLRLLGGLVRLDSAVKTSQRAWFV